MSRQSILALLPMLPWSCTHPGHLLAPDEAEALVAPYRQAVWETLPGAKEVTCFDVRILTDDDVQQVWSPHVGGALVGNEIRLRLTDTTRHQTLVHELVHASLGPSWSVLPPAAVEGLGDVLSERLAPTAEPLLSAIRLLNYGQASAGISLRFHLAFTTSDGEDLPGEISIEGSPAREVRRRSLDELLAVPKRAFNQCAAADLAEVYGAGYFVVRRIVDRKGLEGLWELCLAAVEEGVDTLDLAVLREAAGLTTEAEAREALLEAWTDERVAALVSRAGPLRMGSGPGLVSAASRVGLVLWPGTEHECELTVLSTPQDVQEWLSSSDFVPSGAD